MSVVSRVRVIGPLGPYAREFAAELEAWGYTPLSASNQLRLMAHLSSWLAAEGLDLGELNDEVLQAFLAHRSAQGYTCWLSLRGLAPRWGWLRSRGVVPGARPAVRSGPAEDVLAEYRAYLAGERGLVARTVRGYETEARLFLTRTGGGDLHDLSAGDVTAFVVDQCTARSTGSAKTLVTVLRSLLRWLLLTGRIDGDLAQVVPGVAGWRTTFWGWREKQLPDGTLILTSPSGHTYVTTPGSALLFPSLCYAVGGMPAPEAQTPDPDYCADRAAMMPKRRQARAQDRAYRVATERRHNQMARETRRSIGKKHISVRNMVSETGSHRPSSDVSSLTRYRTNVRIESSAGPVRR
ncbi:hypothetical protein A4G26_15520 [Mycobacterium kansasii]|nr:hypothetical protein A4G26_15520 [Mycobacterium kansasii]